MPFQCTIINIYATITNYLFYSRRKDLEFLYIDSMRSVLPIIVYWILMGSRSAIDVRSSFRSLLSVAPLFLPKGVLSLSIQYALILFYCHSQHQTYYNAIVLCSEIHSQLVYSNTITCSLIINLNYYKSLCIHIHHDYQPKFILHGKSAHYNSETHDIILGSSQPLFFCSSFRSFHYTHHRRSLAPLTSIIKNKFITEKHYCSIWYHSHQMRT